MLKSAGVLFAPVLCRIFFRCVFTVSKLMNSSSAISLLVFPSSMSDNTSSSRLLSALYCGAVFSCARRSFLRI